MLLWKYSFIDFRVRQNRGAPESLYGRIYR